MHHLHLTRHPQQAIYFVENLHLRFLCALSSDCAKQYAWMIQGDPFDASGDAGVVGKANTRMNTPPPSLNCLSAL